MNFLQIRLLIRFPQILLLHKLLQIKEL
jgi:hypothetical protein